MREQQVDSGKLFSPNQRGQHGKKLMHRSEGQGGLRGDEDQPRAHCRPSPSLRSWKQVQASCGGADASTRPLRCLHSRTAITRLAFRSVNSAGRQAAARAHSAAFERPEAPPSVLTPACCLLRLWRGSRRSSRTPAVAGEALRERFAWAAPLGHRSVASASLLACQVIWR